MLYGRNGWHKNHRWLVLLNNKRLHNIGTYSYGEQCLNGYLYLAPFILFLLALLRGKRVTARLL